MADATGVVWDEAAERRDRSAEQRDRAAVQRDRAADERDARSLGDGVATSQQSARDRGAAAEDRGASRDDRESSTSDREAASADRDDAQHLAAEHDQARTRELLHDRDLIAGELHQNVIRQIHEVGMMLDGAQSLSHDPAVIERVAAAAELLDSAVASIRRVVFDLAGHGVPRPPGTAEPALVRWGSEKPHAASALAVAVNGNRALADPVSGTVVVDLRQTSTRVRGEHSA